MLAMLKWGFLAIYSYFAYHLLLTPLLLEFSLYGVALGWGILLALFFLIPRKERKQVTLFVLLILFLTRALFETGYIMTWVKWFYFLIIVVVVYLVARFYGKLAKPVVALLIILGFILHYTVPRDEVRLLNHFTLLWQSPELYTDQTIDYFPLLVRDVNGDGRAEIITFGHREELRQLFEERKAKGLDPQRMPYDLEDEPIFLYIYTWNNGQMERIPNDQVDLEALRPFIPKDFIGFPYYVWGADFTLMPQIQKQNLSEQMGQFGVAPFYTMRLNTQTLAAYMDIFQGIYDRKDTFRFDSPFQSISIESGELLLETAHGITKQPTRATKIIDLIRTADGLGLLLMSDQLELWRIKEDLTIELSHVLSEEDIHSTMSSEFIIADVDQDGLDEILISTSTIRVTISRILKPLADGQWEILFTSPDTSLRFEAFSNLQEEAAEEIIALSKSQVRHNPLRYLTGFTYTEEGLKQNWKTFVSFINVRAADLTGDGQNELVASIYGTHKIFVLKKHGLPVYTLLITIFVLLVGYTVIRRVKTSDA